MNDEFKKKIDNIFEAWLDTTRTGAEIFINPSRGELKSLPSYSDERELKGLIYKGDIYVWGDHGETWHSDIEKNYRIPRKDSLRVYFHLGHPTELLVMMYDKKESPEKVKAEIRKAEIKIKSAFGKFIVTPEQFELNESEELVETELRRRKFFRIFGKLTDLDKRKAIGIVMHGDKIMAKQIDYKKNQTVRERLWKHYGYVDDYKRFAKDIAKDVRDRKTLPADIVSYGY
jgi:hypothetical protein